MFTPRNLRASALVVAVIALVASLGGSAVAAKLLTGKDIRNSSLTGADIKNKSLTAADFKGSMHGAKGDTGPAGAGGPQGAAGAQGAPGAKGDAGSQGPAGTPNGYTKGEADATFLGKAAKAADATKLDGVDGDDYVAGDARIAFNAASKALNSPEFDLMSVGDLGTVRARCGIDGTKTVTITNTSGSALTTTVSRVEDGGPTNIFGVTTTNGNSDGLTSKATDFQLTLQIVRPPVNPQASSAMSTVLITATDDPAVCRFQAHTIDSERDALLILAP